MADPDGGRIVRPIHMVILAVAWFSFLSSLLAIRNRNSLVGDSTLVISGSTLLGLFAAWFNFGGRAGRHSKSASTEELARHEAMQTSSRIRTLGGRHGDDLELRSLDVNSREPSFREEAQHAFDSAGQTAAVHAPEASPAAQREALKMYAAPLKIAQRLAMKAREFMEREGRLARVEETLRSKAVRLAQERAAVQETKKRLEAQRLEFQQLRGRYQVESARMRTQVNSVRQSLAARNAEIRAERERNERDATVLQETVAAKVQEMAIREKALTLREAELQAEEEDVEARIRELESRERQAASRTTELSGQVEGLARRETDPTARAAQFDATERKVEAEERERRQKWEVLQSALRSEQQKMTAIAESRSAELGRRMEEIDGRERSLRAATAQLELERSKLEEQEKAASAKASEVDAAWKRSEARLAELKALEANVLRARQEFEWERSAWAVKRSEELKQLESTRDATAALVQQTERIVAESQRRALVADEAEKAAKRQAADAANQIAELERRRSEADKSEKKAQATLARLQEAYAVPRKIAQRFAPKVREFMEWEGRLPRVEATLRSKAVMLAQERAAVQETEKQLGAQRLELEQLRERTETESVRLRTERDAVLRSLAAKEAEIRSEQERLERDSTAFQETLRARSEEMAFREKTVAARESELQVKGQEVEARIRDLDSRRSRAEQEAQATLPRLHEASQKLAAIEDQAGSATPDLRVHIARMAESDKEAPKTASGLESRKAELDRESTRLASLAGQLVSQPQALQSRTAISVGKPADKSRKERPLATEPKPANGPMEDVPIRTQSRRRGVQASQDYFVDELMSRVIAYILAAILAGGVLLWLARR